MRFTLLLVALTLAVFTSQINAQTRSMAQDPALNNLVHPAGTKIATTGTLGNVRKIGTGKRVLLLIPGLGFGDDIWTEFMDRHAKDFTMYAVTLPGFGETAPLPLPPDGSRYAETPWIQSTVGAIEKLLDQEHIERVTIVAHWALSTQIALRLALEHPDRVTAVVLIAGVLKAYYENTPAMLNWTSEQRSQFVEGMSQRWFRTVTRRTWDDNNFMSYDYAINPRRALFLWREAQAPSPTIWIRYLLEFYSMDLAPQLKNLRVPTLVVQPGFDDPAFYVEDKRNYMRNLCIDSWRGTEESSKWLKFTRIPQSRLFVMYDQPEELDRVVKNFLQDDSHP